MFTIKDYFMTSTTTSKTYHNEISSSMTRPQARTSMKKV